MTSESTQPLYSARPAVVVNGEERDLLDRNLLALSVTESVTKMARCEARLGNWGTVDTGVEYLWFGSDSLDFGDELQVSFDAGRGPLALFQGRITALESLYSQGGAPELLVYAEDGLEALRHTRRSRTFHDTNDQQVIEAIASEYGLQTDVQGLDIIPQDVIAQLDQTDLAFLLGRARRLGLDLWLEGQTLHLQPRAQAEAAPALTLQDDLLSFRVRADLAEQVTALGVTGWDVASKAPLDALAYDSLIRTDVFGAGTGSALIDQTYGERMDRLVRQVPLDAAEAQALADAQFISRAYRFVIGEGVATGNPELRAGKTVALSGLGAWFDGVYHLVAVRHDFAPETGYRTTFKVERPALGEISGSAYGRIRRRRKQVSRPRKIASREGAKKPGKGQREKPRPDKGRVPEPREKEDPRQVETKVFPVLKDPPAPTETLDDPAVTRPSKTIRDQDA